MPETLETPKITIDSESLSAIPGLSEVNATKIITGTKKVIIDGNPPEETELTETSITIEAPSRLGGSIIVLTTENDQLLAVLRYDPDTRKLSNTNVEGDDELPSEAEIIQAIDRAATRIVNAVTHAGGHGGGKNKR